MSPMPENQQNGIGRKSGNWEKKWKLEIGNSWPFFIIRCIYKKEIRTLHEILHTPFSEGYFLAPYEIIVFVNE